MLRQLRELSFNMEYLEFLKNELQFLLVVYLNLKARQRVSEMIADYNEEA